MSKGLAAAHDGLPISSRGSVYPHRWTKQPFQKRNKNCHVERRYDKFNVDVTDALKLGKDGVHELIVRVYDPTDSAHIPLGKQRRNPPPMNIWYTGTEGIWQTVWLERVRTHHLCTSLSELNLDPPTAFFES